MNIEIGSKFVNGFSMNRALSNIYQDLRNRIEVNSVANKYVFADISALNPTFNVAGKYPSSAFKTFTNVADVNIKDISIIPATAYDIKCAGMVPLVDVTDMTLKAIGIVKSATLIDVEIVWLEYISESKQLISKMDDNLIATGADGKLYLSKDSLESTSKKVYQIDESIQIVKVYDTYLDYNPDDIKNLMNAHDGDKVVILDDPLHSHKSWLYTLANVHSASPTISPVGEYTKTKEYPATIAVKSYVDSRIVKTNKNLDNDTIVEDPSTELWKVALDHHTISKNKDGLYGVDLNVLQKELLAVKSNPGNVSLFDTNGYIKDDGYGITSKDEPIDDGSKKLVSKEYMNSQRVTDDEVINIIKSSGIVVNDN